MVSICVTCGVKKPPLSPLSDENLLLLDAIVAPFVDMMDFTGYQLLICVSCKLLIKCVSNFQQTARRSLRAFKSHLNKEESQPAVEHATSVKHIEEVKPELITIKIEPAHDISIARTSEQHFSVPASDDKKTIVMKHELEPVCKSELNYDSESTISADEIPDPISHPDPDPLLARKGSVGSAAPTTSMQTLEKTNTSVNPLPAPKLIQLPKTTRRKRRVFAKTAENAENKIPGFIQVSEQSLREGSGLKRRKPQIVEDVPCPHCKKVYKGRTSLRVHMKRFHLGLKPIPCGTCGKQFRHEIALKWHVKTTHELFKKIEAGEQSIQEFFCVPCGKQFSTRFLYKAHLATLKHTPKEQYGLQCDICKKRFFTKGMLQGHIDVVHLNKEPYKCDICNKKFCIASELRGHVRIAHEKPPRKKSYICHLCGKNLTASKSLKEHLLSHQGLRPFECELCQATFSYSAALYTHKRLKHNIKSKCENNEASKVEKGVEKKNKVKKRARNVDGLKKTTKVEKGRNKETSEVEKGRNKETSGVEKEVQEFEMEEVVDGLDIDSYFDTTM